MAHIHVTPREYRKAFQNHREFALLGTSGGASCYLLLFYSVECGLKSLYCEALRPDVKSTQDLDPDHFLFKHDLNRIILELKLSAHDVPASPKVKVSMYADKIQKKEFKEIPIDRVHEVWRYGKSLEAASEESTVEWLEKLIEFLEGRLS